MSDSPLTTRAIWLRGFFFWWAGVFLMLSSIALGQSHQAVPPAPDRTSIMHFSRPVVWPNP